MIADLPSQAEISRIIDMQDPVVRNLSITQAYHELSCAMGEIFGFEHANWCSFATWASKQAGHTIRGEDLPERVHRMLEKTTTISNRYTISKMR